MLEGTHYNLADMKRRLQAYRKANESLIAEPSISQFFKDRNIQCLEKDAQLPKEVVFESIKIYTERIEKPINFLSQDIMEETKRKIQVHFNLHALNQENLRKMSLEEGVERMLKKQKQEKVKLSMMEIREEEKEQLDTKSQPIRTYLGDNLVPFLTDGLIHVCVNQPRDPVDSLAEYLFKRSLEVPYPDPTLYQLE